MSEDKLAHLIEMHLSTIDSLLAERREHWRKLIGMYKAQRTNPEKTFPWPGCSNIFVPELFDRVSTAAAHIYGTTIRNEPPFLVRSEFGTEEDVKIAEDIEHFITYYVRMIQKQDSYWRVHLPYLILLGTHVAKVQAVDVSPQGYPLVRIDPVALGRMYAYPSVPKWKEAPILSDLAWLSPGTIVEWMKSGVTSEEKVKQVLTHDSVALQTDTLLGSQLVPGNYVPIHDVYVRWQEKGPTSEYKLVRAVFHRPTNTVLWTEDWADKPLPYQFVYWRRDEESVFGIGMGDTLWTVQEAMNTVTNQLIDNMTLANVKMFAVPPGAGLEPGEPIFPGKVLVGVNVDKVKEVRLGDVHPSAYVVQGVIRQIMERNSAFNDTFMGMSDAVQKTRFTFAGANLNVQQGSMRVDFNSAEFEEGLIELVWTTLEALVHYGSGVAVPAKRRSFGTVVREMMEPKPEAVDVEAILEAVMRSDDAEKVREVLFRVPSTVLRRERFSIKPARREANAQVERQAAIVLAQLVAQYLKNVMELAASAQDPQLVAATVPKVWQAANMAMRKVLVAFAVEDSRDLIVEVAEVMNALGVGGLVEEGGGTEQPALGIPGGGGVAGVTGAAGGVLGGLGLDSTVTGE